MQEWWPLSACAITQLNCKICTNYTFLCTTSKSKSNDLQWYEQEYIQSPYLPTQWQTQEIWLPFVLVSSALTKSCTQWQIICILAKANFPLNASVYCLLSFLIQIAQMKHFLTMVLVVTLRYFVQWTTAMPKPLYKHSLESIMALIIQIARPHGNIANFSSAAIDKFY